MTTEEAATGRRPRDRRELIVAAAGRMFAERGFHNVGTDDIAAAVGVTAGALYRHVRNKQDLLARTISSSFERAVEELEHHRDGGLDGLVEALVAASASRRDLGVLWTREIRNLDPAYRAEVREQFFALVSLLTEEVRIRREDLSADDAELLVWAIFAVLTSPAYHPTAASPSFIADVARAMVAAIITTPPPAIPLPPRHGGPLPTAGATGLLPRSRRERLLIVSTRLFVERGYPAVSMNEVGEAAGVTGTAVYRYFPSKSELLAACLTRAADPLRLGLDRALKNARTPTEALDGVAADYSEFALRNYELLGLLLGETVNLRGPARQQVRVAQREYIAEWLALLRGARPGIAPARGSFLVHGAMGVINDVARTGSLRHRAEVAVRLPGLAVRVLQA
ncbi:MAG: TetR/AcrR family transcriptional regulator [Pseudonocardia sp.]|nr:TetR/AcrR family transcriptional regulator [Pseudonocardia sp.]